MLLSIIYLFQTIICFGTLSEESFTGYFSNYKYALELHSFVSNTMLMNIFHALTLLSLAFFIVLFTRKFKILNEKHYMQLGLLTFIITLVYFLPIVYISVRAWTDAKMS